MDWATVERGFAIGLGLLLAMALAAVLWALACLGSFAVLSRIRDHRERSEYRRRQERIRRERQEAQERAERDAAAWAARPPGPLEKALGPDYGLGASRRAQDFWRRHDGSE